MARKTEHPKKRVSEFVAHACVAAAAAAISRRGREIVFLLFLLRPVYSCSGSDRAGTDPARRRRAEKSERKNEKDRKREKKYERSVREKQDRSQERENDK